MQKIWLTVKIMTFKAIVAFEKKMMSWGKFNPLWDMYLNYIPAITNIF